MTGVPSNLLYSYISDTVYGQKAGYGVRAVFFADIPTVCCCEIERQKPRSEARMSENTIARLFPGSVYELNGLNGSRCQRENAPPIYGIKDTLRYACLRPRSFIIYC